MEIISCVNMKGGVAKTTLAVNLAATLARRYKYRVLLIDVDPQFNATQCLFSPEQYVENLSQGAHTIVDLFDDAPRHIVNPVDGPTTKNPLSIEEINPWNVSDRLDLIPGDLELYRLEFVAGQGREHRLKRLVDYFEEKDIYDLVIIDTPPTPSVWMTSALLASNYYMIPVKPEPISRTGIDLMKSVVDRVQKNYGNKVECLGVILTMVDQRTVVFRDTRDFFDSSDFWRELRFENFLPQRTSIAREQGHQGLMLDAPDTDIVRSINNVTKEFLMRLEDG